MFLFTAEANYLPASSARMRDRIWQTPSDEEAHSLLE